MVLVEPPEDYLPAEEEPTSGDFGDIESVLAGEERAASPVENRKPEETPSSIAPQSPILPGEQWNSSTVQQRRKWVFLAAGVVAIIALSTAVFFAILANRNKPGDNQSIAKNEPTKAEEVNGESPEQKTSGSESKTSEPDQVHADDGAIQKPQKPDLEPATEPANDETESPKEQVVVPPPPDQGTGQLPDEATSQDETNQSEEPKDELAGSAFEDLLKENNIGTSQIKTNFGDLVDTLDDAGASLFEFGQIAAVNERGRVGQKKYFIYQPERLDPKRYSGMNLPLAGLQYKDQSLLTVLADFFEISGVPITLDADLLSDAGFKFGYRINDFKLTKTTFAESLQQLVDDIAGEKSRFILEYDGASPARITIADRNLRKPERLPLPQMTDENDAAYKEIIELIKHLTGAENWNDGNQDASLKVEDDSLIVVHRSKLVMLIKQFVESWNKAVLISSGELDASLLEPLWTKSEPARKEAFDWSAKHDTPVLQFLASLQESTNVNVIVNWDRLLEVGWNPRTEVPPDMNEATVGDVLDELTHSMGLAYRVVTPDTFEISTALDVNEQSQLEFFSCHRILEGKLNEKQLVDIVRNALRSTGQDLSEWRVVFETGDQVFYCCRPPDTSSSN